MEEFKQPEEDKDWKEKFFHPANHVREEEPKKARENNDAPIIEDWVSDDEEEVPIPKSNSWLNDKDLWIVECSRNMTGTYPSFRFQKTLMRFMLLLVEEQKEKEINLQGGIKPAIGFMKPFRSHVTILNITLNKLGKFDGKSDEGFFVGYSLSSKAFRVYNIRTRKVQENLHVGFLENKPMLEGNGPKWLFDLDSLTQSMNYVPVVAGTFSNVFAGIQGVSESSTSSQQDQDCIVMPIWKDASYFDDASLKSVADAQNTRSIFNTGSREVGTAIPKVNTATPEDLMGPIPTTEDTQEPSYMSYLLFLSQEEPKRVSKALSDPAWVEAMQEELLQFKLQNVWVLVDLPPISLARIEAIRIFLAYASYMGFTVYQMDVKSAFLYGQIEEEVYVCQPPGFEDPDHPDKVYKVVKALYGLHQAPRAWYDTLATYLLSNGFQRGQIDQTLFIKSQQGHILLVQQRKKGIFISQDKYVHEILKKFNYTDVKSASTPTDLEKPLVKDADADDVDEHLYRSMIGSLMYLTASRPDIMFAVCACARFQVSPKTSHLLAVKRIFRYLKGKPSLGLWYSKDSPLELVAYTDSDYAGATLDRKSTTGGCQFLGNRLISWQCKKQTVVATSTTEAEYVAAASCCGQVLWIQNQLLDYGYNFMNIVIYIDNTSTICIIENHVQHSKTKHIEIRHHFIRDCNAKKLIQMAKIDTQLNVADLLTKGFDAGRFQYLVSSIGMLNPYGPNLLFVL
ncbi:putative ribonuclease H-like domain-containing protein [Tanacetum coccineum]